MKILMLTSELNVGGAETHIETLCRALKALGHELCAVSSGGRTAERMTERGIRHILTEKPSGNLLSLLKAQKRIYQIIKKEMPDIVHAHSRKEACFASVACFWLGVPCVTTAHAMFSMTAWKSRLSRWGEHTVAVSRDIEKHLVRRGRVDPKKITVIENGVFLPPPPKAPTKEGHSVLFVSRMDKDCSLGAHLLCKIAPRLCEKYPDVHITAAGGGDDFKEVLSKAERVNRQLGRRVIDIIGRIDEPSSLFGSADVFVGVSRAALEAMAAGLPVILLGNEGFSGLFTKQKLAESKDTNFCARGAKTADADALFSALDGFFSLPASEKAKLSGFCRETVKKYCSAERMAEKTLDLYKKVIEDRVKKVAKKRKDHLEDPKKRILLCGYFGFENLGDDAILRSVLKKFKSRTNNFKMCYLGSKKSATPCVSSNSSVGRVGFFSVFSIIREMKNADAFLFGGGSLLQNKTSDRSLIYYLFLITLARKYCKKTVMLANGIGPIKNEKLKRAAIAAVNSFDLISVRDTKTRLFLQKALPRRKIFLFPDPTLLLFETKRDENPQSRSKNYEAEKASDFRESENYKKIAVGDGKDQKDPNFFDLKRLKNKYFAVCICGGELRRHNVSPKNVADALLALSKAHHAQPYFLIMNRAADLEFTQSVARLLSRTPKNHSPCSFSARAAKIFCPKTAYSARKFLSLAEFSLCMRYHASLFSALSGKPTLSLGSDAKLRALSSDLCLFPAVSPSLFSDIPAILSAARDMLAAYKKNTRRTQIRIRQMRALCDKQFDNLINYFNALDFE